MPSLLERSKQKGIEIGIPKGIEIGILKGKVKSVLLLLSSRFGFVPPQVVEQLNAIEQADIFRLDDLLILASKCQSLEEFEKALSNEE